MTRGTTPYPLAIAAVLLFAEGLAEVVRTVAEHESLALLSQQEGGARSMVRDLLAFVRDSEREAASVLAANVSADAAPIFALLTAAAVQTDRTPSA